MHAIKQAIKRLQRHSGFSDLLTYLNLYDEATVLHKDYALSCHFRYQPVDMSVMNDNECDYHSATWAAALALLGDGWLIETNVMVNPLCYQKSEKPFPDIVSAILDDERRQRYQDGSYFEHQLIISFTWKPPQQTLSQLSRFAVDAQESSSSLEEHVVIFWQQVNEVMGLLQRSLVSVEKLTASTLVTFLHQCINLTQAPLAAPSMGCFLDTYLAINDFSGGFTPQIGEQYCKVLSLQTLPPYTMPAVLDAFADFPIAYRWHCRFLCLSNMTAQRYIKRTYRNWSSKAMGVGGVIREAMGLPAKPDQAAQTMADSVGDANRQLDSGETRFGFFNTELVIAHSSQKVLSQVCQDIKNTLQQQQLGVRIESINAIEAYLGSLPGHGDYNLRKRFVDTTVVSHCLPTTAVYQGEATAPSNMPGYEQAPPLLMTKTQGSQAYQFNCHVNDVGHTLVLGPTGTGKTTLFATLMTAHRQYQDSRIVVLDVHQSNRAIIRALKGRYCSLSGDECQLSPLLHVSIHHPESIDQAVSWLSSICFVQGISPTPEQQQALRQAVERCANESPEYRNLNHLSLQNETLRTAINTYNSGSKQALLNGVKDDILTTDVVGIDISSLLHNHQHDGQHILPILLALMSTLNQQFNDKRPTLLLIEEGYTFLQHPMLAKQLTTWFKTLRKFNVAMIFNTQDVTDITQSAAEEAIKSACLTRIYCPHAGLNDNTIREHYQRLGLNDRQIELLQTATPKQDYLVINPSGSRLVQLDLGDCAKAFCCVSHPDDLKQLESLLNQQNTDWIVDWLRYKGLEDWASHVRAHYCRGQTA